MQGEFPSEIEDEQVRRQRLALLLRTRRHADRYSVSTTKLRAKIHEWQQRRADLYGEIDHRDSIIEQLQTEGTVDDGAVARLRLTGFLRKGQSTVMATSKLRQHGFSENEIARALDTVRKTVTNDSEDIDLVAGLALARRRKLGCFAPHPASQENTAQWWAEMRRYGFPSAVISMVLATEIDEAQRALRSL